MPGQDRTGPQGKGPMTGRKEGRCAGKKTGDVEQATPTPRSSWGSRLGSRLGLRRRKGAGKGRNKGRGRNARQAGGTGRGTGQKP